jgi:protein-tyrosine phosphatase
LRAAAPIIQRGPSIINSMMPLSSGIWEIEHLEDVFWIKVTPPVGLAIVLRPRDEESLKDDLLGFRQSGVDVLVSLLEPDEASWLGLRDEGPLAEVAGMHFLSYPIRDTHVPANIATFRAFVAGLADRLRAGERIGVHCRGSIGRSTVTAACALIHMGWNAKEALSAIEAARGTEVPDTEEQLRWILKYKAEP